MKVQFVTAAVVALVGGGVALGLSLAGGSTASPVVVQQVNQPIVTSSDASVSSTPTPSQSVASPSSAAVAPSPTATKVTHVAEPASAEAATPTPNQSFVPIDPSNPAFLAPPPPPAPTTDQKLPPTPPKRS